MAASINRIVSEKCLLKFGSWKNLLFASSQIPNLIIIKSSFSSESSSSDSSSSDDEKEVKEKTIPKNKYQINDKLSSLLSDLKIENSIPPDKSAITLKLAKPPLKISKEIKKQPKDERYKNISPDMTKAVKDVATSLGGDVSTTESELLLRLKSHSNETRDVSNDIENEQVKNIGDLFVGMKIDKNLQKSKVDQKRTHVYQDQDGFLINDIDKKSISSEFRLRKMPPKMTSRVNVYESDRLGIFNVDNKDIKKDVPETPLWNELKEHELKLLVTHPPKNAFEEMIYWTEEGKLWHFPIDNEQGLEEEKKVGFHEHVFLDYLLEGFPKKGPIRHFMELVIVGLSKNPYITVERKKEHVEWYRQYFKEKEDILREIDASLLQ